jgi:hypothetical protein
MIKAIFSSKRNIVLLVVLLFSCIYAGVHASYLVSNNSDVYSSTYLVADSKHLDDLHFQQQHPNFLKLPFLWLQAQIGSYGYTNYMVLNVIILTVTVVGWLYLLLVLTKGKYFAAYALGLIFILLTSSQFAPLVAYTTTRNIEWPLGLLMIVLLARSVAVARWRAASAWAVVFGLLLASDALLVFTLLPALLIAFTLYYLRTTKKDVALRKQLLMAAGYTIGTLVVAKIIVKLLIVTKVVHLTAIGQAPRAFINLSELPDAILTTFQHVLQMLSANIFGIELHGMQALFGGAVLLLLLAALIAYGRTFATWHKTIDDPMSLAAMTLTVWTIFIVGFYMISGQWKLYDNVRYITLLPLTLLLALPAIPATIQKILHAGTFLSSDFKKVTTTSFISRVLVVLVIPVLLAGLYMNQKAYANERVAIQKSHVYYQTIKDIADQNNVHVGVAGYWDAIRVRFWTDNQVFLAPIADCSQALPYLTNGAWYDTDNKRQRSMLIVDYDGADKGAWASCVNKPGASIEALYGMPSQKIPIKGLTGNTVEVWLYDYDVRAVVDQGQYYK